jgi:DNA-binding response OmpR family regulator
MEIEMLKNIHVLYAEDEAFIKDNVTEALTFMDMKVTAVSNGEEAYNAYLKNKPDIIIADIEMPYLNGLELAQKIRQTDNNTQIIIATAYTNTEYFLKAVELNLVKYLLKPISLMDLKDALTLCIKNLENQYEKRNQYFNDEDYYNLSQRRLYVNGRVQRLDYHEREFLELLLRNYDRVVTYDEMEKQVWGGSMTSAAVRSLVRNLRKKLPTSSIKNVSKMGYKIVIQD